MYRNTYVEINENNIKNNIKNIKEKYNNYKYYIGVVKGNAYGHGFYIVKAMKEAGINYFATSSLEEAIELRKYDSITPILCLEPINTNAIEEILKYNVTVTIDSLKTAQNYINLKFKGKLKVHLKLDTGMNRLGIKEKEEVTKIYDLFKNNNSFILEGVYTHMATTGINDYYFDKQLNKFLLLTSKIDLKKIPIVHIGRSLTLVNHPKLDFVTGIRLGIIMYGFNGSINIKPSLKNYLKELKRNYYLKKYHISATTRSNDLKLKTSFCLYTEVMSVKKLKKGEFVGYGASFIAPSDIKVAILPIGYADGMTKKLKYISIKNKKYKIIDVCMDMTIVLVDNNVSLHDKVEIFGDTISIKEASRNIGINSYHLFLSITNRVPRIYDKNIEIKY